MGMSYSKNPNLPKVRAGAAPERSLPPPRTVKEIKLPLAASWLRKSRQRMDAS